MLLSTTISYIVGCRAKYLGVAPCYWAQLYLTSLGVGLNIFECCCKLSSAALSYIVGRRAENCWVLDAGVFFVVFFFTWNLEQILALAHISSTQGCEQNVAKSGGDIKLWGTRLLRDIDAGLWSCTCLDLYSLVRRTVLGVGDKISVEFTICTKGPDFGQ